MKLPDHLIAGEVPPLRVWLDGVEQQKVMEAHLTEGWLIKFIDDEDGNPVIDGDEYATERLTGNVTVELIESQP